MLSERCAAIRASPLAHGQAADDAEWEEQDGTADAEQRKVVFQDPHPAGRAASNHHDLGGVGLLGHHGWLLGWVVLGVGRGGILMGVSCRLGLDRVARISSD